MQSGAEERPEKRCGCTGVRWCAYCLDADFRRHYRMDPPLELPAMLVDPDPAQDERVFVFDPSTQRVPGLDAFSGLFVVHDFLSLEQERRLLSAIEETSFVRAQSGKQKQHFGPKVNFNKMRVNTAAFHGLPAYASALDRRLREAFDQAIGRAALTVEASERARAALSDFETTDLFVLRYQATQDSNLDLHIDDNFAYGEAIFGVSLESDSVMTFYRDPERQPERRPERDAMRPERPPEEIERGRASEACVRVPLPARSAIVLTGAARFDWEHAILARDIVAQRTSITLRTLSPGLRDSDAGRRVREIARRSLAADQAARATPLSR